MGASQSRSVTQGTVIALTLALFAVVMGTPVPVRAQDPYPQQTIAFFNATQCPGGWTPTGNLADAMNGRFVVPLMPNGTTQETVDTALKSGENRTHTHSFSSSILLDNAYIKGVDGCCNDDPTSRGPFAFDGTTAASSVQVPYVQLLVCLKEENPAPNAGSIPSGILIFTAGLDCPNPGWSQPAATQGRFLVGLPAAGQAPAAFGGGALAPNENRTHAHSFSGGVTPTVLSLVQAPWTHSWGYGHSGTYDYSGNSSAALSTLPYMQLLQCQKD
ncbi:hypothetical protein YTPLAS18_12980 [Nitrospira sp.]|nr:hypothetical protein YTPLAS18_12980 [Nitrospira sp.]